MTLLAPAHLEQDTLMATESSEKGRFTADEPGGLGETLFLKVGV